MKRLSFLIFIIFSLFLFADNTQAKVLPQSKNIGKKSVAVKNTTSINVSPKLRGDKKALIVYFSNLQNAKSVSYMLVYKSNGQEEGAMGGINLTGLSNQSQELLFGTCSKNVCRYHTNIKNARLEVSYTSQNGKKYLKKYKIKI